MIGSIFFGLGAALQQICSLYYVSESVPKTSITIAISLALTFIGLGVTLSPVIINTMKQVIFGMNNATASLLIAACGYVIILIVELIRETKFNKNSKIGLPFIE